MTQSPPPLPEPPINDIREPIQFAAWQIRERDAYWMAKLEEARKEGYEKGYKDGWDARAEGEMEG